MDLECTCPAPFGVDQYSFRTITAGCPIHAPPPSNMPINTNPNEGQRMALERLDFAPQEMDAIDSLARKQGMSREGVIRQAMRLYQMHLARLEAGETVAYSGDQQRARDFAGQAGVK